MKILAIETSCDETAIALVEAEGGLNAPRFKILKSLVASQIKIHAPFGGVVPNLAKREHLKNLPVLFGKIFSKSQIANRKWEKVDLIAVTVGPGLEPALWTGIGFAKELREKFKAQSVKGKIIGVNHLEGHLYSFLLPRKSKAQIANRKSIFPAVALIVSGGHTILLLVKDLKTWRVLGETRDDAVGEAYDKVARLLRLPYPGGPEIERLARKGNSHAIEFPRPMIHDNSPAGEYDFSFSGLKTSVLYLIKKNESLLKNDRFVREVCHEFQEAVTETLIAKTIQAGKRYSPKTILLAGGVSANQYLQKKMAKIIKKELPYSAYHSLDTRYSLDNATMIAIAGFFRWEKNKDNKNFQKEIANNWKTLQTQANLELK